MDKPQIYSDPTGSDNEHKRVVAIREIAFGLMCSALEGGLDFYQVPGGWESGAKSALRAAETIVNYGRQR